MVETCSVSGCGSAVRCKGVCASHYQSDWRRRHQRPPHPVKQATPKSDISRTAHFATIIADIKVAVRTMVDHGASGVEVARMVEESVEALLTASIDTPDRLYAQYVVNYLKMYPGASLNSAAKHFGITSTKVTRYCQYAGYDHGRPRPSWMNNRIDNGI